MAGVLVEMRPGDDAASFWRVFKIHMIKLILQNVIGYNPPVPTAGILSKLLFFHKGRLAGQQSYDAVLTTTTKSAKC